MTENTDWLWWVMILFGLWSDNLPESQVTNYHHSFMLILERRTLIMVDFENFWMKEHFVYSNSLCEPAFFVDDADPLHGQYLIVTRRPMK